VVNADDPIVTGMAPTTKATIAAFGSKSEEELGKVSALWARITPQGTIRLSMNGDIEEYSTDTAPLVGAHNRYNMAAAIIVARRMGISQHIAQEGISSFLPLEHRLEVVTRDAGRVVVNDSKSTTVAASLAALVTILERHPSEKIALLIGGLSKAGSWTPLLSRVAKEKRERLSVVCFGKDGPLLASHCRAAEVDHSVAANLREATAAGLSLVREGGVLLLSPGCASFDEFTDFEHRGTEFKRYVRELVP
jgi:UDP-N-acetylmuramoylalanine--D-glutamate ligase